VKTNHVEIFKGVHKKLVMVSSYMVLLPAWSCVFLLSVDKNESMDCCRFIVSGKQQMRNDTNARVCAPARRNEEKPAEKKKKQKHGGLVVLDLLPLPTLCCGGP